MTLPRHYTLLIEKISRAAADQRAGRPADRAWRLPALWSREEHGHRPQQELPEVKRLDLAEVVLALKAAGSRRPAEVPLAGAARGASAGACRGVARGSRGFKSGSKQGRVGAHWLFDVGFGCSMFPRSDQHPTSNAGGGALPAAAASALRITAIGRKMLAFHCTALCPDAARSAGLRLRV